MKKALASLMLALFALGSPAVFGQDKMPDKCKNMKGAEQQKCVDDAKKAAAKK
jgi:hypothetical protein